MAKVRRFLSWAAVSSLPQAKKISLEDQLADNRAHAEKHDGVIVGELVVPGQSRKIAWYHVAMAKVKGYYVDQSGNRESCHPYAKLLELIEAKAFDVLIYLDRSRIGRDAALSMAVVSGCREAGLRVYEIESPPADIDAPMTHMELMMGAFNSVQDQKEVEDVADKHRKGMRGRILGGEFPAAIPWPRVARYTPDGKRYVEIDPQGQAVLLRLCALYANEGYSLHEICRLFNSEGIPAPASNKWKPSKILEIIDRIKTFAGYVELNRRSETGREFLRAKSKWPPVIPEKLADAVIAERNRRAESRQGYRRSAYRFAGMCYCLMCGNKMRSGTLRAKRVDGSEYVNVYYRCDAPRHPGGHISERYVYDAVSATIEYWQQNAYTDQLSASKGDDDPAQQIAQRIADLRKQENDLQGQIERADDLAVTANWTRERYERQIERIGTQLAAVQAELRELLSVNLGTTDPADRAERIEEIRRNGSHYLNLEDPAEANVWLRQHFKIFVQDGEVVKVTDT